MAEKHSGFVGLPASVCQESQVFGVGNQGSGMIWAEEDRLECSSSHICN